MNECMNAICLGQFEAPCGATQQDLTLDNTVFVFVLFFFVLSLLLRVIQKLLSESRSVFRHESIIGSSVCVCGNGIYMHILDKMHAILNNSFLSLACGMYIHFSSSSHFVSRGVAISGRTKCVNARKMMWQRLMAGRTQEHGQTMHINEHNGE